MSKDRLFNACRDGKLVKVKHLVEHEGANVHDANYYGKTALYYACDCGKLEIAKYLVAKGANVNVADHQGWPPLHVACFKQYFEIVRFLLTNGALVNHRDIIGQTALHKVCAYGGPEIGILLIEFGADVKAKDNNGNFPFEFMPPSVSKIPKLLCGRLLTLKQENIDLKLENLGLEGVNVVLEEEKVALQGENVALKEEVGHLKTLLSQNYYAMAKQEANHIQDCTTMANNMYGVDTSNNVVVRSKNCKRSRYQKVECYHEGGGIDSVTSVLETLQKRITDMQEEEAHKQRGNIDSSSYQTDLLDL